jgi:murein DD-endopeptidase MepM/ murein hydrolase activator NlpD
MLIPDSDLKAFAKFLVIYQSKKTQRLGIHFEKAKNKSVDYLMLGRGRFQKRVLHGSIIGLASVGVMTSGVMGGDALLASSFPAATGSADPRHIETFDPNASGLSLDSLIDFKTTESQKPRSEILEYEVKSGETLSQIAEKFNISSDTIKWANDMQDKDTIKPAQKLKILPVSGVAVTVKSGDTIESLAKKYNASAQGILDFPFNDIPDDFKLTVGQVLIVPDGSPPEAPAPKRVNPQYMAQGPGNSSSYSAPGGGSFIWPTSYQQISTYFAWWHPGIDLANRAAPGVVAADGGTVVVAGWPDNYGYGNRVVIDHGNGYRTLYAHLSNIYVSVGQKVSRGTTIGQMGSTGRSTGTHLHFEIQLKGIAINPLAILR